MPQLLQFFPKAGQLSFLRSILGCLPWPLFLLYLHFSWVETFSWTLLRWTLDSPPLRIFWEAFPVSLASTKAMVSSRGISSTLDNTYGLVSSSLRPSIRDIRTHSSTSDTLVPHVQVTDMLHTATRSLRRVANWQTGYLFPAWPSSELVFHIVALPDHGKLCDLLEHVRHGDGGQPCTVRPV